MRYESGCVHAAYAGPTCIWPRAIFRRAGLSVVPGHEVVGTVDALGDGSGRFALGDRIGIPWLAHTCGRCRFCRSGRENLCVEPRFTGWDLDGGYAEFAVVDEAFAYPLPDVFDDQEAAPLLCAGIIGYRSLRRTYLPRGGRLGIYGFGGSAHLTAQIAMAEGARVHVMTRGAESQALAAELGAASVGGSEDLPPEPLDAAILFAPVGTLVPTALAALDRGGRLAIAGIHLTDIPSLDYERHLFEERELCSVTANTRDDGVAFLDDAARIPVRVAAVPYDFDQADIAPRRPGPRSGPRRSRPRAPRSLTTSLPWAVTPGSDSEPERRDAVRWWGRRRWKRPRAKG